MAYSRRLVVSDAVGQVLLGKVEVGGGLRSTRGPNFPLRKYPSTKHIVHLALLFLVTL